MNNEQALFSYWFKENDDAIELFNEYSTISQIWDDLYDNDKPVTKQQINAMMTMALVEIPKNPFFQQHYLELMPMVEHCLMTWLDANVLEEIGDDRDLQVSYILRSVTTDLAIHIAGIVGGSVWRRQAALAIRQYIYHDNEAFEEYRTEILSQKKSLAQEMPDPDKTETEPQTEEKDNV